MGLTTQSEREGGSKRLRCDIAKTTAMSALIKRAKYNHELY